MSSSGRTEVEYELIEIIAQMDLPLFRKDLNESSNVRWMLRNMGIRNRSHPQYDRAVHLLWQQLNNLGEK